MSVDFLNTMNEKNFVAPQKCGKNRGPPKFQKKFMTLQDFGKKVWWPSENPLKPTPEKNVNTLIFLN